MPTFGIECLYLHQYLFASRDMYNYISTSESFCLFHCVLHEKLVKLQIEPIKCLRITQINL